MRPRRICIATAQVPFSRGGAEMLADSLHVELERRGFAVEIVRLPYSWTSRTDLFKSGLAWRLLDLRTADGDEVDLVIATRFPSYLIRHPRKVVWLVHQFRQVYDLKGTRFSDFGARPEDPRAMAMIEAMDRRTLSEAQGIYAISRNVAERLRRFNGLEAGVLYPPPPLEGSYRSGDFGEYVFAAGRLDELKRFDLLIRALAETRRPVRCRLAGRGGQLEPLKALAARLGVAERVEFLGWVSNETLLELYAGCLGVFYAPFDEDYGYVTVEAFKTGKPVLTAADSGGVLELVEDGASGFVCPPDSPAAMARRLDQLWDDRELARRLGAEGQRRVAAIGWDQVVRALTAPLATLPEPEGNTP